MSKFKEYPKVYAFHKEEAQGILQGEVHAQEKYDGANASIWLGDDGRVCCGSRNFDVTDKPFQGFPEYVQ